MIRETRFCWGLLWRSQNKTDGLSAYLICASGLPVLFSTRQEARDYIKRHYGYIRKRPDLCREPYGWKVPTAIKVAVLPASSLAARRVR